MRPASIVRRGDCADVWGRHAESYCPTGLSITVIVNDSMAFTSRSLISPTDPLLVDMVKLLMMPWRSDFDRVSGRVTLRRAGPLGLLRSRQRRSEASLTRFPRRRTRKCARTLRARPTPRISRMTVYVPHFHRTNHGELVAIDRGPSPSSLCSAASNTMVPSNCAYPAREASTPDRCRGDAGSRARFPRPRSRTPSADELLCPWPRSSRSSV